MTIDEAKKEIPDFETFATEFCNACTSDAYCPSYCDTLKKAERIFDRVLQAYAKHDGDMVKVDRYIRGTKGCMKNCNECNERIGHYCINYGNE